MNNIHKPNPLHKITSTTESKTDSAGDSDKWMKILDHAFAKRNFALASFPVSDLDGKLLWEFDGKMSNLVIPSPFASNGLLYITSGYFQDRNKPVIAIKPGAKGNLTIKEEGDSSPKTTPNNSAPLKFEEYV